MYGSELCYIGNASLSSPFTIGDSTLRSFRDAASRLETRRFDTPSDGPGSMTPEAWKALSAAAKAGLKKGELPPWPKAHKSKAWEASLLLLQKIEFKNPNFIV